MRMRLDRVVKGGERVAKILDLEDDSLTKSERREQIRELVEGGAGWLESLNSVEAIKQQLRSNEGLRNRTTLQLQRFLGTLSAPEN